jgi:hypothetical protein
MRARYGALVVLGAIVACSDSPTDPPSGAYTIGGTVLGLEGNGLVLTNDGADPIAPGIGSFTFPTALATGESYDVTVQTQPTSPSQVCTVQNGSGTVADSSVTAVAVTCS